MPFTFSHPAIILPLKKYTGKWFSLTALVIGNMAPDFEYFFRMKVQSNYGHTIAGAFYFDLPIGFIFTFVFHNLIRNPLYQNLPRKLRSRFIEFEVFDWRNYIKQHWLIVIFSLLIGIFSHLLWDSFTHLDGYSVQKIPRLKMPIDILGYPIPLYKILQHFSTVMGGLFIFLVLYNLPIQNIQPKKIDYKYWLIVVIIIFIIFISRILFGISGNVIGQLIVTGISASIIALISTPIFIKLKMRK